MYVIWLSGLDSSARTYRATERGAISVMTTTLTEKEEVRKVKKPGRQLVMYAENSDAPTQLPGQGIVKFHLNPTLKEIFNQRERYVIPGFQRKLVRKPREASVYMLMLLRRLPVPPICVFQEFDERGRETREVADGQQALLASIFAFFQGQLRLPQQDAVDTVIPGCRIPLLAPGLFYKTADGRNQVSGELRD